MTYFLLHALLCQCLEPPDFHVDFKLVLRISESLSKLFFALWLFWGLFSSSPCT